MNETPATTLETFDTWHFSFNRDATIDAYSHVEEGSASQCGCGECLNWLKYRSAVIPKAVLSFFVQVGIDVSKESELSEYQGGPTENLYIGEYHFVGKVFSGPDPFVPCPDGNGCSIEPIEISDGFKLGLSSSRKFGAPIPTAFGESPVVTVIFEVTTPRDPSFE